MKTGEGAALHGYYIERRSLAGTSVSKDIAHHLYTRQLPGDVIIVTSRPEVFMASVSKQWSAVIKQVERQMASTLNAVRREELMIALAHMRSLRFSVKPFTEGERTGVVFMTQAQCMAEPPICHTMYVTENAVQTDLQLTAGGLRAYGLLVLYKSA